MQVLILNPNVGGNAPVVRLWAVHLARQGHQVHLVANHHPNPHQLPVDLRENLHLHPLEVDEDHGAGNPALSFSTLHQVATLTLEHDVQVVHTHDVLLSTQAAVQARKLTGQAHPVVVTVHGSEPQLMDPRHLPVVREVLGMADHVTARSRFLACTLAQHVGRTAQVTPSWVDTHRFTPQALPPEEPVTLLHFAGVSSKARSVDALLVLQRVLEQRSALLRVVGQHLALQRCEDLARSLGVLPQVNLVHGTRLQERHFQGVHLQLLTREGEAHGQHLLDGLACGVPAVASRSGAHLEVLHHGQGGVLVPTGDVQQMAGAVLNLMEDQRTHQQLRAQAVQRSLHYAEDRLGFLYRRLLYHLPHLDHPAALESPRALLPWMK